MNKDDIRNNIIEFNKYRDLCKYHDCLHHNEEGCKIKELVNNGIILPSRYENYIKFLNNK
jgi:ribosome biogenesis GTPase